jgi:GNAT superfamily N-acetyltransferase
MSSNTVETYQAGYEAEIVEVFEAAFGENAYYFPRNVPSWLWRYTKRPGFDPESILMIRKKGALVATLSMTYGTLLVNGNPKKIALIDDVSTIPQWRRKGFATKLVGYAINRAKELDCWGVHLVADPAGSAIQIYEASGFELITSCINMLSVLKHRRAARFAKRGQAFGLLALSLLDHFKNTRINKGLCETVVVEGPSAVDVALRTQSELDLNNGTIMLDAEYVNWMTSQRPDGLLKFVSILKDQEFSGSFTISSSNFSGPGATDRMAVIGGLTLSEKMQTKDTIAAVLQGAKMIAKNSLNCAMVSMFVDERAETVKRACKKAGFMEVGKSASMFHPLGQVKRLTEIREGIWNQPVETSFSNP